MQISVTIPDEKLEKFRELFLKANPKPDESTLTDLQWVKQCIREWLCIPVRTSVRKKPLKKQSRNLIRKLCNEQKNISKE